MAWILLLFSSVLFLNQVKSQIIRSPLSLLNRPFTDTIIEAPRNYIDAPGPYADATRNYIDAPRNYIDTPRNYIDAPGSYADATRNYIDAPRNYIDAPRNYIDAPRNYIDAPRNYFDIPIDAGNYVNAPRLIEARNYVQAPSIIAEAPCNGMAAPNLPGIPNIAPPSTTIITDCTPSVCQNLANTINLMVVSNFLQNAIGGDQAALKFAGPLLKDLLSNPGGNPKPSIVNPNGYAPNIVAPNIAQNFLPQNVMAPNVVGSNVYGPSAGPRVASSVVLSNGVISPNTPTNSAALISSLMQLLGGAV